MHKRNVSILLLSDGCIPGAGVGCKVCWERQSHAGPEWLVSWTMNDSVDLCFRLISITQNDDYIDVMIGSPIPILCSKKRGAYMVYNRF